MMAVQVFKFEINQILLKVPPFYSLSILLKL